MVDCGFTVAVVLSGPKICSDDQIGSPTRSIPLYMSLYCQWYERWYGADIQATSIGVARGGGPSANRCRSVQRRCRLAHALFQRARQPRGSPYREARPARRRAGLVLLRPAYPPRPSSQYRRRHSPRRRELAMYPLRARSRPCLARELPHHRVPVCSRDGGLRNRRRSITLDLHKQVAKPTVRSIGRA